MSRRVAIGIPRTRPGAFIHRITINEADEASQDASGQYVPTDSVITDGTRFAAIEPVGGIERDTGSTVVPERKFIVTLWRLAGVKAKQWIMFGSRKLEIVNVLDEGEVGSVMRLECVEKAV